MKMTMMTTTAGLLSDADYYETDDEDDATDAADGDKSEDA